MNVIKLGKKLIQAYIDLAKARKRIVDLETQLRKERVNHAIEKRGLLNRITDVSAKANKLAKVIESKQYLRINLKA